MQAGISELRGRCEESVQAALAECGWPPSQLPAASASGSGGQPSAEQAEAPWPGFQTASPAALSQLLTSFTLLTRLQIAAGCLEPPSSPENGSTAPSSAAAHASHDGDPDAPQSRSDHVDHADGIHDGPGAATHTRAEEGSEAQGKGGKDVDIWDLGEGPWGQPEVWAVRALTAAPAAELRSAFCTGGALDRADATPWLCAAAAKAAKGLAPRVDALRAPLDALGLLSRYDVHLEFVRALHGEVAQLLLVHRLPMMLGARKGARGGSARGRGAHSDEDGAAPSAAAEPAGSAAWLQFADTVVEWEGQVRCLLALNLAGLSSADGCDLLARDAHCVGGDGVRDHENDCMLDRAHHRAASGN